MRNLQDVFLSNLKYYTEKAGISQVEIAKRLGLAPASVNKWFTRTGTPQFERLEPLCNILGCTVVQLFTDLYDTPKETTMTIFEHDLFETCDRLNADGKHLVKDYADMLVMSRKYEKSTTSSTKQSIA